MRVWEDERREEREEKRDNEGMIAEGSIKF